MAESQHYMAASRSSIDADRSPRSAPDTPGHRRTDSSRSYPGSDQLADGAHPFSATEIPSRRSLGHPTAPSGFQNSDTMPSDPIHPIPTDHGSPDSSSTEEKKHSGGPDHLAYHPPGSVKGVPMHRTSTNSSFPPDAPWSHLHRASAALARPPKGRRSFAPINWIDVGVLVFAVAVSWCLGQFAPAPWCAGLSLTAARVVVGVIGVIIGILCGYALFIRIARRIYAATVYSTLVHQDMTLADVDRCAEPGPFSAMHLLRYRLTSGGFRRAHRPYDQRPWTLVLIYFLWICLLANIGNFLYGRTVIINALNVPQNSTWNPIPVLGELTPGDIAYGQEIAPTLQSGQRSWSFAAPASFMAVPSPASLNLTTPDGVQRTIYFVDTTPSLFSPTSVGPAASLWRQFLRQQTGTGTSQVTNDATQNEIAQGSHLNETRAIVPVLVDYPAWGTEVRCSSFSQAQAQVQVDSGGNTTVGIPVSAVQGLVSGVAGDPNTVTAPGMFNISNNIINFGTFPNDGLTLNLTHQVLDSGSAGDGYTYVEVPLVRINTANAPSGTFFQKATMGGVSVGIDGAVCVSKISPYVVRAVDAAGVTSFSQVVKTGADLPVLKGTQNQPLFVAPVQPLTSTNKSVTFLNAFSSCRNQIVKDNGPGAASEGVFAYLPNPTTVQMSTISAAEGTMPLAFGQLNNVAVEQTIASAQARYLLPYLVGGGRVAGRAYPYKSVATAYVETGYLALLMGIILGTGLIGACFVPRPPFNLPLKDLNVSNWLSFAHQVPQEMLMDEEARIEKGTKLRYGK